MTDTAGAPAVKEKRTRKASPTPPAFDFTALKPKTTAPPARKVSASGPNPTVPWVKESWANRTKVGQTEIGEGKSVIIPTANVQQFRNLLNYAARDLNVGVTVNVKTLAGGKTEVTFAAKTRKQKKAKAAATANQGTPFIIPAG